MKDDMGSYCAFVYKFTKNTRVIGFFKNNRKYTLSKSKLCNHSISSKKNLFYIVTCHISSSVYWETMPFKIRFRFQVAPISESYICCSPRCHIHH